MEQFTVDSAFILEAHKAACATWKAKLEKRFPQVFKAKHKTGNRYELDGMQYILSQTDINKICLISLKDGNRFVSPIDITDSNHISDDNFLNCCGSYAGRFIKIDN